MFIIFPEFKLLNFLNYLKIKICINLYLIFLKHRVQCKLVMDFADLIGNGNICRAPKSSDLCYILVYTVQYLLQLYVIL